MTKRSQGSSQSKKARLERSKKAIEQTVKKIPKDLATQLKGYTPKQASFFFWYSILGNATKAMLRVSWPDFPHDTPYTELTEDQILAYHNAGELGRKLMKKVENPIALYFDQQGMDFKLIRDKLLEGMGATKTSNAAILLTGKGETMKAEEQGLIEVPDHPERRQWFDRFAKLLGLDLSDKKQVQAQQTNVYVEAQKDMDKFVVEDKE